MTEQTEIELLAWHPTGFKHTFVIQANHSVLIGKSRNCGVRLNGHDISDIHCSIGFGEGKLWVQDWMSASGTKVNGESIHCRLQFGQGCVVEIGSYKIQVSKSQQPISHQAGSNRPQETADAAPETTAAQPHSAPVLTNTIALQGLKAPVVDEPVEAAAAPATASDTPTVAPPVANVPSASDTSMQPYEEEFYDRETVELLLAEIEDLRTALAQSDSTSASLTAVNATEADWPSDSDDPESDHVLQRIQELSEEANRAEERVLVLEEMLLAAEDANRAEIEERSHLEAWVGDIEKRLGQRESEHAAELDALRGRLEKAEQQNAGWQQQLQHNPSAPAAQTSSDPSVLESLQEENRQLQDTLAEVTRDLRQWKLKFENQAEATDSGLREERAKIAREQAEMSRLKFEYAQKIKELEELPKATPDPSFQGLREHREYLRQVSSAKKEQVANQSLSGRLKRIWSLLD